MDSIQRAHVEHLLQINRAHQRELQTQQAKLGVLAPSGIAVQLDEYQHTIADLERQLAEALPHHNLPPRDYERFVGRQPQLAEVRRLLLPYPKSRHHLVTIDGIGGIGKSALALETAYHARESYANLPPTERFEAIVWVSAKRTYLTADGILEQRQAFRALDDLYTAIAQVLDYPAITRAPAAEQRAIVERVLAEQRTLLILDNLETVDDEELLIFLRLLPDPTKAIVTTRHRIDVAYPVRLLGMPQADALALIVQETARKGVALAQDEQAQLFARTGGVPLAIVWSVGLMGLGGSVESVLRRLGSGQSDIARFCFAESVALIRGRDAHKLLLALSLFAADASREALGIVAGLGEDEFGRDIGLEELLRLSLVNKEGERFGLLPLTKSFVWGEAEKQDVWMEEARDRCVGYFCEFIQRFEIRNRNKFGLIEPELKNIFTIIDSLISNLKYQKQEDGTYFVNESSLPKVSLLASLTKYAARSCRVIGYWRDSERLCRICINIVKSVNPSHTLILLDSTDKIGLRCIDLSLLSEYSGDTDTSKQWAFEALRIGRDEFDNRIIYLANIRIASAFLKEGNINEAENILILNKDEFKNIISEHDLSFLTTFMGHLYERKGDMGNAIKHYQQSANLDRKQDYLTYLADNLLNLGRVILAIDNNALAHTYYKESLKLAQECGRVDVIAKALYSIASLELSQNQRVSAESNARQALDIFRRLGMQREQAEAEALLARLAEPHIE